MPHNDSSVLKNLKLPSLFEASDSYSAKWQRRFIYAQKIQLFSLIVAAVGGATSWLLCGFRLSAFITCLALLATLCVRLYLSNYQPERKWYKGRAVAESLKTLAWKYALCAQPFVRTMSGNEVDELFLSRVKDVLNTLPQLDVAAGSNTEQITSTMRELRASDLKDRKELYVKLRVEDQITWYSNKAIYNSGRAGFWAVAITVLEAIAIVLALLRLAGNLEGDISGILATSAAAAMAWLQSKQHETLAQSYSVTSNELALVNSSLQNVTNESAWALKVEQAEEAMSREHTMWIASHR